MKDFLVFGLSQGFFLKFCQMQKDGMFISRFQISSHRFVYVIKPFNALHSKFKQDKSKADKSHMQGFCAI